MVKNLPAIKEKGWLGHVVVDSVIIQCHKLIPLCADHNSMGYNTLSGLRIPSQSHVTISGGGVGILVARDKAPLPGVSAT